MKHTLHFIFWACFIERAVMIGIADKQEYKSKTKKWSNATWQSRLLQTGTVSKHSIIESYHKRSVLRVMLLIVGNSVRYWEDIIHFECFYFVQCCTVTRVYLHLQTHTQNTYKQIKKPWNINTWLYQSNKEATQFGV